MMKGDQENMDAIQIAQVINDSGLSLENARKEGLLPMNVKAARKILKEGGYDYDRATKQWTVSQVSNPLPPVTKVTNELLPSATVILNDDELTALKQLAQQLINSNMSITPVLYDNPDIELYDRTRKLEKGVTTRKTYVVDDAIAIRFDKLADRANIDKSQLLTLALTDFLAKYEG